MKKISLLIVLLFCITYTYSQPVPRPKIVIGIVMDQMRWDYLYRYYDKYSQGGFKRLMREGFNCNNAYINYLPSYTAPGHATIYTGTTPAHHGIVSNDWIMLPDGSNMYCVQDDSVFTIGTDNPLAASSGKKSPKNVLSTTISDELKLHFNFRNKSFGVSLKDRGAIIPAGHTADGAFWLDRVSGYMISSSFYYKELPKWVSNFNQKKYADSFLKTEWTTLYPISTYTQSTSDSNHYEGKHSFETSATFPHDFSPSLEKDYSKMPYTPYGNTLVRLFAEELIINENLGKGAHTDFLAISFSATDYIGHLYGTNSIEVEDMYYRLDKEMDLFLTFLDKQFGKNNYLLFLTADHGGAHNAQFLIENKIPAGFFEEKNAEKNLRTAFLHHNLNDSILIKVMNDQVYLNMQLLKNSGKEYDEIFEIIKQELLQDTSVAYVADMTDLHDKTIPEFIRNLLSNSYNVQRSGQIQIILKPGHYSAYGYRTGTTHGGWHNFDTHIPLIFYGWNIPQGKLYRRISMTDIAPTLAAILSIQEPNASIGEVITEVVK